MVIVTAINLYIMLLDLDEQEHFRAPNIISELLKLPSESCTTLIEVPQQCAGDNNICDHIATGAYQPDCLLVELICAVISDEEIQTLSCFSASMMLESRNL